MCGRCEWVTDDPLYITYHDEEWGVPVRGNDVKLFEMLTLEGAQAGLSWITILKRREGYREAFDGFDPEKVAQYGEEKIAALLQNPGIIRNKLKVRGTVTNARAFLQVQREFGSFSDYVWAFVDGKPIQNAWTTLADVPAQTDTSTALSKALKKRGFTFVGPTIMYAFMQATGMVNDHTTD
ncbi:MAG: DNA-3-methyladenine glycosylase I, partial [Chloroflexota bacterium]